MYGIHTRSRLRGITWPLYHVSERDRYQIMQSTQVRSHTGQNTIEEPRRCVIRISHRKMPLYTPYAVTLTRAEARAICTILETCADCNIACMRQPSLNHIRYAHSTFSVLRLKYTPLTTVRCSPPHGSVCSVYLHFCTSPPYSTRSSACLPCLPLQRLRPTSGKRTTRRLPR